MATKKRKNRMGAAKFAKGNKYAQALKMTKGKTCDRKAVLKGVKRGMSPSEAASRYCQ